MFDSMGVAALDPSYVLAAWLGSPGDDFDVDNGALHARSLPGLKSSRRVGALPLAPQ